MGSIGEKRIPFKKSTLQSRNKYISTLKSMLSKKRYVEPQPLLYGEPSYIWPGLFVMVSLPQLNHAPVAEQPYYFTESL